MRDRVRASPKACYSLVLPVLYSTVREYKSATTFVRRTDARDQLAGGWQVFQFDTHLGSNFTSRWWRPVQYELPSLPGGHLTPNPHHGKIEVR